MLLYPQKSRHLGKKLICGYVDIVDIEFLGVYRGDENIFWKK